MNPSEPHDRRPWRTDEEWARLHSRLTNADADAELPIAGRRRPIWAWPALAAAILLAAIGLNAVRRSDRAVPKAVAARVVTTKAGERSTIHLDDSSTITLAPATTLRIGGDFARREIELDGMADFHLRHDPRRTFVVRTRDAVTTDIGTQFVIRGYASDSSVSVAVSEGSVLVQSRRDSASTLTLSAGEVAQVRGASASRVLASAAPLYSNWVDGGLSFDNATLADVALDLDRWFDVEIQVPKTLQSRRVSAIYNSPTLNAVLDALSATMAFSYTRDGHVVTIRERAR